MHAIIVADSSRCLVCEMGERSWICHWCGFNGLKWGIDSACTQCSHIMCRDCDVIG